MSKVKMMSAKDKKKGALVPRLRFPEFRNEWTYDNLGDFLEEYSEKVNADTTLPIYSSTRDGLKAQKDYFNGHELINSGEYGVVPVNCFVYRHMSDDNIFIFNINLIGEAIAVSKEYPVFKAKNMSPLFLYYILNYGLDFKRFAAMQKKGGTRTRLYFSTLCSWKTLLPTKPEQQRIADCLSSLDERITAETSKLDALKAHKKGLLKQLFPAKGETLPQLRFPEFRDAGEWEEKPLIAVADYENGKAYEPHIIEGGRYLVVNSRFISTDGAIKKYSNEPICIAKRGDILMVLSDLPNGRALAKSYYADADNLYAVNQRVCRLTPHSANGKFLCFLLDRHPNLLVFDDGKNQTHLKKNSVLQCLLKLPLSFDEQQRIADCLSSLDELITAQTQKIELLKVHKKGLMQQLFPVIDEAKA